ncbi:Aldo/keto reductase family domain containing protein [Elaphomyces granulatus]
MGRPPIPLSANLPPLIMGTATFNSQYNPDPYILPTTALVHRALSSGIRAFDTSPYYGPAEELLGCALSTGFVRSNFPRHTYRLLTKVGRLAASSFDYSPAWIRHSVLRSLQRLDTFYLDVVYCHDVEFVTPEEVLNAVRELRRIRDMDGLVHYVGISGYPVQVVCSLAEMILRETGEPLDVVMSYANFTLQNTRLLTEGLPRLLAAGVDVVLNASPLGMGLLRRQGVPIGRMGDFHPAPDGLRSAINAVSVWVDKQGEKLEAVAIRFALESWLREGARVGVLVPPLSPSVGADASFLSMTNLGTGKRLGSSVMGVSHMEELEETLRVWRSIIDDLENQPDDDGVIEDNPAACDEDIPSDLTSLQPPAVPNLSDGFITDEKWSRKARLHRHILVKGIRSILGSEWRDYEWPSPGPNFVNSPPEGHKDALEKEAER